MQKLWARFHENGIENVVLSNIVLLKPLKQSLLRHFLALRRDGIIQRYHKWIRVRVITEAKGRYEFYGRGRDLRRAVEIAIHNPPDGYVNVDALDFIENPHEYCVSGEWIWYEIES